MPRDLLEDQIYSFLCTQLHGHQLEVGTHLKAGDIAQELDVSRTSVRKAIIRLVEDGCVQMNPAGRPIVVALPKKRKSQADAVFAYANQTEQAYWAIFDSVFEGKLREGTNVNGQELAADIGVSLGTVRQALDWLCRDGLLVRLPRRGWRVVHLDEKDIVDAFQIRSLLETEALGRAILHVSPEQLEQLIADNTHVVREGMTLTEDQRRRIDYQFHRTLLEASESTILLHAADPMIRKCMLTGIPFDMPMTIVTATFEEHIAIANALLNKDLQTARETLQTHLMRSMQLYEQLRAEPADRKPLDLVEA